MNKKYTTAKGIRIAYLEKNPEAKNTIFFIHGNSLSANSWTKQFQSELLTSYRLVAFDLPAHGDSDASPDPDMDYTFAGLASILTDRITHIERKAKIGN